MSLSVLVNSALEHNEQRPEQADLGEVVQDAVVTALKETPLRVEVFEKAAATTLGEDLSIADVHVVLDALIEVLEGD